MKRDKKKFSPHKNELSPSDVHAIVGRLHRVRNYLSDGGTPSPSSKKSITPVKEDGSPLSHLRHGLTHLRESLHRLSLDNPRSSSQSPRVAKKLSRKKRKKLRAAERRKKKIEKRIVVVEEVPQKSQHKEKVVVADIPKVVVDDIPKVVIEEVRESVDEGEEQSSPVEQEEKRANELLVVETADETTSSEMMDEYQDADEKEEAEMLENLCNFIISVRGSSVLHSPIVSRSPRLVPLLQVPRILVLDADGRCIPRKTKTRVWALSLLYKILVFIREEDENKLRQTAEMCYSTLSSRIFWKRPRSVVDLTWNDFIRSVFAHGMEHKVLHQFSILLKTKEPQNVVRFARETLDEVFG